MGFPFSALQVAHGFSNPGPDANLSIAFPGNVTKGDLLIMWGGNGYTSLTDTQGNIWSAGPTGVCNTTDFGAGSLIWLAFAIASATGPCTVTISNPGVPQVWCCGIAEYSVNPPTADKNSGNALGNGNGKCPSPITPALSNTIVIAAAIGTVSFGGADVWTVDSGFTIDDTLTSVPFNAGFCLASLNVAAPGAPVNPTFSNPHWGFGVDVTEFNFAGPQIVLPKAFVNTSNLTEVKLPWPEGRMLHSEGKHYKR